LSTLQSLGYVERREHLTLTLAIRRLEAFQSQKAAILELPDVGDTPPRPAQTDDIGLRNLQHVHERQLAIRAGVTTMRSKK
jgi:hypothetical protein